MKLSKFARAATVLVPLLTAGCASKPAVVTTWKKPASMTKIDGGIAMAECQKQALMARKRYLAAHPKAALVGFNTPAFQVQQAAQDRCMSNHGLTITSRKYR